MNSKYNVINIFQVILNPHTIPIDMLYTYFRQFLGWGICEIFGMMFGMLLRKSSRKAVERHSLKANSQEVFGDPNSYSQGIWKTT